MISELMLFVFHSFGTLRLEEKIRLFKFFGKEEEFRRLSRFELEWVLGRSLRTRKFDPGAMVAAAEVQLKRCKDQGISYVCYGNPAYPADLKEIYDPPLLLFFRGTLPPAGERTLAVVGTRKPSLAADRAAFALGLDAAVGNIPLISGMAAGIDGASHSGALAAGGKTWAVLGTGCDRIYPGSHRALACRILETGGGLLSEFVPGTGPARYNFPKRNRIISGLSRQIVIVQAPARSGALYTADFALEQGRDVSVHEAGIQGVRGRGTANLAEQGAQVISRLKDLYPGLCNAEHPLDAPVNLSDGTVERAAAEAALLIRRELEGTSWFYKGRVQF